MILMRYTVHDMYVCLCKGVSDKAILREVANGATTFREVRDALGVGTQCGKCACDARALIADAVPATAEDGLPLFYTPGLATA